jgi:nicotinamidase-related amidase
MPADGAETMITLDSYPQGALGGRVGLGRGPAVIVIDLINGFTDPAYPPGTDLDDVVAATRVLLDAARDRGHPVVFTTIAFDDDDPAGLVWRRKMPALTCLRAGSVAVEVDGRLGRRPDEPLLVKTAASAFHRAGLHELLSAAAVDTVVLAGATTSGCVRATAVDACAHDLATAVVRGCVGDRHPGAHAASLFDLDAKYADVVDLPTALGLLAGTSAGSLS